MANSSYVIIGNGVAGTTCAEQLRRHDPSCEIRLFTDEPYPLYNRVALPPFLKGKIPEARVLLKSVDWHVKNAISLHLSQLKEAGLIFGEREGSTITYHLNLSVLEDVIAFIAAKSPFCHCLLLRDSPCRRSLCRPVVEGRPGVGGRR